MLYHILRLFRRPVVRVRFRHAVETRDGHVYAIIGRLVSLNERFVVLRQYSTKTRKYNGLYSYAPMDAVAYIDEETDRGGAQ